MSLEIFSANIKFIRKKTGYSQKEFAALLGVTRSSIGAWEEGRAYPHVEQLLSLCDTLRVKDIRILLTVDMAVQAINLKSRAAHVLRTILQAVEALAKRTLHNKTGVSA